MHKCVSSNFKQSNKTIIIQLDKEEKSDVIISQDTLNAVVPPVSITGGIILLLMIILCIYCKVYKPCMFKKKPEKERKVYVSQSYVKEKSNWLDQYIKNHPRIEETYAHVQVLFL